MVVSSGIQQESRLHHQLQAGMAWPTPAAHSQPAPCLHLHEARSARGDDCNELALEQLVLQAQQGKDTRVEQQHSSGYRLPGLRHTPEMHAAGQGVRNHNQDTCVGQHPACVNTARHHPLTP